MFDILESQAANNAPRDWLLCSFIHFAAPTLHFACVTLSFAFSRVTRINRESALRVTYSVVGYCYLCLDL